ncbi:MAG: chromosome condensation regulator RCC1 [Jatrophihabitantaceae bacterium]
MALIVSASLAAPAGAASGSPTATATAASTAGPGDNQIIALEAGAVHTCATLADNSLRCWGNNQYGQLGDGNFVGSPKPVDVTGLTADPALTLSRAVHNCSLLSTGSVECWAMNIYGQLGNGTFTNSSKAIPVKGLTGAVRLLAVGGDHTCVTYQADDTTWCWGQNKYGELGDGTLTVASTKPVQVKGMPSPPVKMIAGLWHTCAILKDGTTWCWGFNGEGQLGIGTQSLASPKPVQVKGLPSTPTQLVLGLFHTCALVQDGSTWCWGEGKYGQLGNGSTKLAVKPTRVVGLPSNPTQIYAGGFHTCATFADGTMSCWGQNIFGQLGNGNNKNQLKPVAVKGFRPNPTLVAAGNLHTCAAYADGAVNCWGLNSDGQLGNGTKVSSPTPVAVVGLFKANYVPVNATPSPSASDSTSPASSAPATSAPAVASSDNSSGGGTSAGKVVAIIVAIVLVLGLAGLLVSRRRRA